MPRNFVSIATIGALFFIFGFATWLCSPLIAFVQLAFEPTVFKLFLVTFVLLMPPCYLYVLSFATRGHRAPARTGSVAAASLP